MIKVDEKERIRRAYHVEHKSIRQIAREMRHSRRTVRDAIASGEPGKYTMKKPREAPVMGPYKERVRELFEESKNMPRKQRYTGKKIYEIVRSEGFRGSQATIMFYLTGLRKEDRKPKVYLQLEYDPGTDAQADWGDAQVKMRGEEVTVQLFVMRLCYSRKLFLRAFPSQKQESFFEGHVRAFRHFGGVPRRVVYDNLKTAVYKVLEGKNRQEQEGFIVFRSHYLFESRYCNVAQGHEKGGVEHGVGFSRRNYMVPLPDVEDFDELNEYLLRQCELDDGRQVKG